MNAKLSRFLELSTRYFEVVGALDIGGYHAISVFTNVS